MGKAMGLDDYDKKREANIRLGTMKLPDELKANQALTITIKGKVKSFSSDYGNNFTMEIQDIHVDGGMVADMKKRKHKGNPY